MWFHVISVIADGRTDRTTGRGQLGGAVCADIISGAGVFFCFRYNVTVAQHLSGGLGYVNHRLELDNYLQ